MSRFSIAGHRERRDRLDKPLIVRSANRSHGHNRAVGATNEPENLAFLRKLTAHTAPNHPAETPGQPKTQTIRMVRCLRKIRHRPNALAPLELSGLMG